MHIQFTVSNPDDYNVKNRHAGATVSRDFFFQALKGKSVERCRYWEGPLWKLFSIILSDDTELVFNVESLPARITLVSAE